MKNQMLLLMLCLVCNRAAMALQITQGLDLTKGPGDPYYTYTRKRAAHHGMEGMHRGSILITHKHYGSFTYNEPSALKNDPSATTFNLKDLIGTSIKGMLNKSCGSGYCITGVCARWSIIFGLNGFHLYTYLSPQIRDTLPVLLISAYNGVGNEPLKAWRDTVGAALAKINTGLIGTLLSTPDGLHSGSIGQPGQFPTVAKEVDIIGHPLAALPDLVNNGHISTSAYQLPGYGKTLNLSAPSTNNTSITVTNTSPGTNSISTAKAKLTGAVNKIKQKMSVVNVASAVRQKLTTALSSLSAVQQTQALMQNIQTIRNIKKYADQGLQGFEAASQAALIASGIGIIGSARFEAPRLFCPTKIKAWQPYYLSFADAFWWRAGYPITDGPISGSDKSSIIFNPVSLDTLPPYNTVKDVLKKPVWGHMYPRDDTVAGPNGAQGSSVIAWRGLDVLKTAVKAGTRVGIPLPESIEPGKWQLIFPEVRQCRTEPDYPDLKQSLHGGYAWNYYKTTHGPLHL